MYAVPSATRENAGLTMEAASAAEAAALVSRAHSANGVVRWFDDAKNEEEV